MQLFFFLGNRQYCPCRHYHVCALSASVHVVIYIIHTIQNVIRNFCTPYPDLAWVKVPSPKLRITSDSPLFEPF
ncbi:hypothetical protein BDV40DRAFT_265113 [Aspergillus tamarii]|uniref:Uncharacterized protein n=1 Tax=Aspergillus tamarii TaxID=41984 RepID=A0A5N6UUZ5_ASPTM|nr:hypothetical protein BDV40DRAFT_265113 [Aspergillus tamarii]